MISKFTPYKLLPWGVACILVMPIVALVLSAFEMDDSGSFRHLFDTVLLTYSLNTLLLILGVITLSFIIALPLAWFVACCEFPSRRILQWALMLPLALPPYIVAIVYTDLLDYSGPIQQIMREVMGWQHYADYFFPNIRSLPGAILILSLTLYPYLYLLLRGAFLGQSGDLFQAARSLGMSPLRAFFKVSLPLSRSATAVGLSLIAMESLGDFATVNYFAVSTLTTGVYDTWLELGSLNTAAKISSLMLLILVILISLENYSRRKLKVFQGKGATHTELRFVLRGWKKYITLSLCWGLLFFAFILPIFTLVYYAFHYMEQSINESLWQYSLNSFWLAIIVAFLALAIALIVNFYQRLSPGVMAKIAIRLSSLGYAVPGTVVAIAVLIPFSSLDIWFNRLLVEYSFSRVGLLFSGSLFILVMAYLVRFSAIAVGSIESSLNQVSPSLDDASRSLGVSPAKTIYRVNLPLIRKGMLTAFILVFIEAMKELPTALLLRPFNFETLATYVYQFVSDEMIELAALPALIIVLMGLLPFIIVNRLLERAN